MVEQIGVAIITILAALITTFVIPYIKEKTSKEQREKAIILSQAAVMAAEQIFTQQGQGQEKKTFVVNFLNDRGLAISEKEIDILIEAAVKELKLVTKR